MTKFKLLVLINLLTTLVYSQPQWKFHIAFEDATGAKDTIWWIWDTTATGGVDVALGEGAVQMNYSAFNVFIGNAASDTTKTQALPYIAYPSHSAEVFAINYQYPITISWDSSLFHAPYLPATANHYINVASIYNDYFFLVNNAPWDQQFNMLVDNEAIAPAFFWGSQEHFPMYIGTTWDPLGTPSLIGKKRGIAIFPNPSTDFVTIKSFNESIRHIEIFSVDGCLVYNFNSNSMLDQTEAMLNLKELESGIYLIKITSNLNTTYYEKISK